MVKNIFNVLVIASLLACGWSDYDQSAGFFRSAATVQTAGLYANHEPGFGYFGQTATSNELVLNNGTLDTLTSRELKIMSRTILIVPPAGVRPTGNVDLIPGAKIICSITIRNLAEETLTNSYVRDILPSHTHLYYADMPTLTGDVSNVTYDTPTGNIAAGEEVKFKFDILPQGSAVFIYTATVD
jgi:hypothetical protein